MDRSTDSPRDESVDAASEDRVERDQQPSDVEPGEDTTDGSDLTQLEDLLADMSKVDGEDLAEELDLATFEESLTVFFTTPGYAREEELDPLTDDAVVDALNNAQHTADIAVYGFDRQNIVDAVIAAHNRGVTVRVVGQGVDDEDQPESGFIEIGEAGVPTHFRGTALMHDKFVVVDQEVVVTGSMNFSESGVMMNNNHVVVIRDRQVASLFTAEFEQMYVQNRYGGSKESLPGNRMAMVDGIPVEVFFSPEDDIEGALRDTLASADESVMFMVFAFTLDS
ncbi:MAG: DUF1669 domain-containing protein, partial [Myxococcales bacterium]|nr:DUF1669 domain-containing protein [Myxococcales bacterium]